MGDEITLRCAHCRRPLEDAETQRGFYCSLGCALDDLPDFI